MSTNPVLNPVHVHNLRPGMVVLTHQPFAPKYMLVTCATQVGNDGGVVYVTFSTLTSNPTESSLFCEPTATFQVVEEVEYPHQGTPEWNDLVKKYSGGPAEVKNGTQGVGRPSDVLRGVLMGGIAGRLGLSVEELEKALDGTLKPTLAAELGREVGPSPEFWVGANMSWRSSQPTDEGEFGELPEPWKVEVDEAVRRGDFSYSDGGGAQPNMGCLGGIAECQCNSRYTKYEDKGGKEYFLRSFGAQLSKEGSTC